MNSTYSTASDDYVDIHGRNLNVQIADDGTIYVPFHEIRKAGFHIFPKAQFSSTWVSKELTLREFKLYMLGVATEFLIQNNIRSLNHGDIMQTINECGREIFNESSDIHSENSIPTSIHSGTLGRTLLADPLHVKREVMSNLQMNLNKLGTSKTLGAYNATQSLRYPHNQPHQNNMNDNSKHGGSSSSLESSSISKLRNRSNNNQNNRQNDRNEMNKNKNTNRSQYNNKKSQDQQVNKIHNFAPNAKVAGLRENGSRSVTDSEDNDGFVRLSEVNVSRIELQKTPQKVKVVYIDKTNDKEKYWVQLVQNEATILEILEITNDISDTAKVVTPKLNEIYMAMSKEDELWYRVVVQRVSPGIKVHFIDFGNDGIVSAVRELPNNLKKIPGQAVRITLSKPEGSHSNKVSLKEDDVVTVRALKQFADTTILAGIDDGSRQKQEKESPETVIMDVIKYSSVNDNEQVKIMAHSNGVFYLRNKEHHDRFRNIEVHVRDSPKEQLKHVENNQVVLCKKEDEEQLCRAVIRKIVDGLVTVHFMDFHTEDTVSIKSLYGITKSLAHTPVALIESPQIRRYSPEKFNEDKESLIDEMISNKVKFTVALKGKEFDLMIKDKPFSEMLFPIERPSEKIDLKLKPQPLKPSPPPQAEIVTRVVQPVERTEENTKITAPKKSEQPQEYVKLMFENMPCHVAPLGKGDYMLTNYNGPMDFTVTSTGDHETEMLAKCTCIEIDDEEPYEPEDQEIVLAYYEGGWFRGAVVELLESGKYQILFIEYGNTIEVTTDEIRRVPPHLRENIPMVGLSCQMEVPDNENVRKKLSECMNIDTIYEMNFLSYDIDTLTYTVEIPKLMDALKKEGLL